LQIPGQKSTEALPTNFVVWYFCDLLQQTISIPEAMESIKNILGVVLCGGESKRMGTDKGLKTIENTIWAHWVAAKLNFLNCPVVYSVNPAQFEAYSAHIPSDSLITDDNNMKGPMRGLFSVHNKFQAKDLLVLACDMLELDDFTIRHLMQVYEKEKSYDFYVHEDKDFDQPFCSIYTGSGLQALEAFIQAQTMTDFSMQSLLRKGNTKRITINHTNAFENYNTIRKKND